MANNFFSTVDPLYGLENIPGVLNLPGAENYLTGQQFGGGVKGLIEGINASQNLDPVFGTINTLANAVYGAKKGGETGMSNLATMQKLRQDLIKSGIDITKGMADIKKSPYELAELQLKVNQGQFDLLSRTNLMNLIQSLPPSEQKLAASDPKAWADQQIKNSAPTDDVKEYEYAVKQFEAGKADNPGSFTDWYKNYIKLRAPSTQVSYGSQNPYGKVILEKEAEYASNLINNELPGAEKNVRDIEKVINLIEKGDPATGILQPYQTGLQRVQVALGLTGTPEENYKIVKQLEDTQLLNAVLGRDVFKAIGALGIGARGIDTPAEREFLREVLSGKLTLEKGTLLRLARDRMDRETDVINRYNRDLKRGRFSRYENELGVTLEPIDLQKAPKPKMRYNPITKTLEAY